MSVEPRPHCAKFSDSLLPVTRHLLSCVAGLPAASYILDPFGGIGKNVDYLCDVAGFNAWGVELEPEWAVASQYVQQGDALDLFVPSSFLDDAPDAWDAVVTSPCLEANERVLTADLTWKAAGEVVEGERLMAFDEQSPGLKVHGHKKRRKWRIATVQQTGLAKKDCVRVILANGDEVICSTDHPWLCQRYSYGGLAAEWVEAGNLMGGPGGPGRGRVGRKDSPWYVQKQLEPWVPNTSYKAGWLAGMFDGEGCLSFGHHGSPKMIIAQNAGPIADQALQWLRDLGFTASVIPRRESKVINIYIGGGFPGVLRALGELRPSRLMAKLDALDLASRCIEAALVEVVAVEPVGRREIAAVTTDTGTYIGEGYLHHNTYGNRMADVDMRESVAGTYAKSLGRRASEGSSCHLQWGPKYREFHLLAWNEARRVLRDGGWFLLNIKDHVRGKELQRVPEWHVAALEALGFELDESVFVGTPGNGFGANKDSQVDGEWLHLFQLKGSA